MRKVRSMFGVSFYLFLIVFHNSLIMQSTDLAYERSRCLGSWINISIIRRQISRLINRVGVVTNDPKRLTLNERDLRAQF